MLGLGRTNSYLYDQAGRVTRQTFPDTRYVVFDYDDDGNLVSVTPPSRPSHAFAYDSIDRPRATLPPVVPGVPVPEAVAAYNADHQPVLVTRADGQVIEMQYDPTTGKLDQILTPTGAYVHAYDPATGQLSTVSDPYGGSLTYGYAASLITSETLAGPVSGSVSWTYDDELRVQTESIDGAHTVTTVYDSDGAPSSVGDLVLVTDPLNGELTGTTLAGVTSSHAINAFGEPSQAVYEHGGLVSYDMTLVRDPIGRIQSKVEVREGTTTVRCYEYDLAGRLADVYDGADALGCTGNVVEHYGWDDNGNRQEVTNDAVSLAAPDIVVDAQDRLLQYGGTSYAYTEMGDVASKTDASGTTTYDYDVMGNLRGVDLPDGTQIEYLYDARGRRVGKRVDGALVQGFLYGDQLNPIAELDGSGTIVRRFVYGVRPNVPDYMVDVASGTLYRYIADQLGSVVMVVDATGGTVAQELSYDSWGRVLDDSVPGFQPFGYAGGLYDTDTGWVLFGARDYRPEVGAWAAKDPLGFAAGDANLYRYVLGDPVNFFDPTGRSVVDDAAWWLDTRGVDDAIVGWGDTVSFGLGRAIRKRFTDSDDAVNYCAAYYVGVAAGIATEFAMVGWGTLESGPVGRAPWLRDNVFRWGKGAWKRRGNWIGPKWHFHLGPKPLLRHHLPYEFKGWWNHLFNGYVRPWIKK